MTMHAEIDPLVEPLREIFLAPGTFHCAVRPTRITTVLGSCVAVCLWDPARRLGGMNHYVLPVSPDGDRSARYGDVAIEQLVEAMARLGCRIETATAKLFGGAKVLPYGEHRDTVGDQNVRLALERLRRHRIRVGARRTGGERGLLVKFETQSGVAMVRAIAP
jgi:chemotaxis protein CheD